MSIKSVNEVVMMSPLELIPYWRNPRKNDKTVEALVHFIPIIGFNQPIVIDKNRVIVKGHARHEAAIRVGMDKVPVIISENDENTNRLDRIADNKVFEITTWEVEKIEPLDMKMIEDDYSEQYFDETPHVTDYEFVCPYCGALVEVTI